MRLYLLKRIGPTDYDQYAGIVVAAPDEMTARNMAHQKDPGPFDYERLDEWDGSDPHPTIPLWTDPTKSTADIIGLTSRDWNETKIIMADFRAG